jgi:alkylation response protein AidB-like acyl-CoA dehydrogenase
MDFAPSDSVLAAREATAQALAPWDTLTGEPVEDWRPVWTRLIGAGLVGLARPDADASGVEWVEVLLGLGRRALHVPVLAPTALLPVLAMSESVNDRWLEPLTDGSAIMTAAVAEVGVDTLAGTRLEARPAGGGWSVSGRVIAVPFAHAADRLVVWARGHDGQVGLFLVDPRSPGVTLVPTLGTTGESESTVVLDSAPVPAADVVVVPGAAGTAAALRYEQRLLVGLAAEQLGLAEAALELTAGYASRREQFGRPIATFQAVSARAADAFIDVTAMRWTMYQAAAALCDGGDAGATAAIAKFWAAEGGSRVMAAAAHLHGGLGVDTSYPLHRFYLRSRRIEMLLGGAGAQLTRLWEATKHDPV